MAVSKTWILSLKLFLISSGLVSISILIKLSVPLVTQFISYQIPLIWSYLTTSLLSPLYLYLATNLIIIIIVISSRYQNERIESEPLLIHQSEDYELVYGENVSPLDEAVKSAVAGGADVAQVEEEFVEARSFTPQRSKSRERLPEVGFLKSEKPPLVCRGFGNERSPKSSPQAKIFDQNANHNESIENTWKSTTEQNQIPILNKCDTWQNQNRSISPIVPKDPTVKKSATFRDRTNYDVGVKSSPSPNKEPTLSHDELNHRVEAFIRKFNDEMRRQRQESLNQYMDLIKRAK